MRKNIAMTMLILYALFLFTGCARKDIVHSDGSGVYNFYVGDVNFNYERTDSHSGHMVVTNRNSVIVSGVVKRCEGSDCDVYDGNYFYLRREGDSNDWYAYYPSDENIEITMNYNGKETINLIQLAKISQTDDRIEIVDVYLEEGTTDGFTQIHYSVILHD